MKTRLPKGAALSLDAIHRRLSACLQSHSTTQTWARSHFMKYGESVGGQMLESDPKMEHPYDELLEMYCAMFSVASEEGVELREIETRFLRQSWSEWTHETRWVAVREYDEFLQAVAPVVERIRVLLRQLAADTAATWESISFETKGGVPRRVIVFSDRGKQELVPMNALVTCVEEISAIAAERELKFVDGGWDVESEADDVEGEIDSTIGVI